MEVMKFNLLHTSQAPRFDRFEGFKCRFATFFTKQHVMATRFNYMVEFENGLVVLVPKVSIKIVGKDARNGVQSGMYSEEVSNG